MRAAPPALPRRLSEPWQAHAPMQGHNACKSKSHLVVVKPKETRNNKQSQNALWRSMSTKGILITTVQIRCITQNEPGAAATRFFVGFGATAATASP